jgi:predicted PurR-regulated permease PerM
MVARILLVGILAAVAVMVISAVLMFLAPYLAIAFVAWAFYRGHRFLERHRKSEIIDVVPLRNNREEI